MSETKPAVNPLVLVVLVVAGIGLGYVAGLQLSEPGLEDVYAENYAYVGGGVGLILGLLFGRKKKS